MWVGAQAKTNGLVDQLGGLDKAIEVVKQQAHLNASDRITLVPYPGRRSALELLLSRADPAAELDARVEKIAGKIGLQMLAGRGFLKMAPYTISVR